MYRQLTHCHSQELKLHFFVLSGSIQISSVSISASYKTLLQQQRSKDLLSYLEEELLSQEDLRALRTQVTALPTTPSFILDRLFASTSSFNKKQTYFILQIDYFCWII